MESGAEGSAERLAVTQPLPCQRPGSRGLPPMAAEAPARVPARVPGLPLPDTAFPQPARRVSLCANVERPWHPAVWADARLDVPVRVLGRCGEHAVSRL